MHKSIYSTIVVAFLWVTVGYAQDYLKDRGTGVPASMFGTYINEGELLVYPFFEYYYDNDMEYSPIEFGFPLDKDYRGKFRASEWLIFIGYGISDRLFIEMEVAGIDAKLEKAADDDSEMPDKVTDSGLGDVQIQLDWRWWRENANRPEFFSYMEVVFPHDEDKPLRGTADWEIKMGSGIVRGFGWGTMTVRGAVEYSMEEDKVEIGEIAVEYLKRLSDNWRIYGGFEGAQDEVELITELQWHISDRMFFKFNNAFGITSKATDWAPEIGMMFLFPVK